ncbi:MAG: acyl-[acyl-carrier-protein]--UDP-N-acetylglucosamine O-acyltransferase [Lentisphaerae bacterium GWF2_45_14]|nr:MAG: acyl-[acyl-carrier-protein]--UDP-N-acetylglucosamine O-acyltransferase [Lentisphaerae bacterium GWF2_45_14]
MISIHPTAVVSPEASIGDNVRIGPYSIISQDVVIGEGCFIDAHVKVGRFTKIGPNCRIYYGALVGEEPQDHRFTEGVTSYTEIGHDTVIREYVTIHRPPFEGLKTVVGDHVLLMAFVHVAHDVIIGNSVTIANHTAITGHVQIEDGAVLSGYVKIHQFCRIGSLAMIGADATIVQDVPPYCLLTENSFVFGPNTIGLRRAGFDPLQRAAIRKAIKTYFFQGLNTKNALEKIESEEITVEVSHFTDFIKATRRGIMPGNPRYSHKSEDDED